MADLAEGTQIAVRAYRDFWIPARVLRVTADNGIDARADDDGDWSLDLADEGVNWRRLAEGEELALRAANGAASRAWLRVLLAAGEVRECLKAFPWTGGRYRRAVEALRELDDALDQLHQERRQMGGTEETHAQA